MMQGRSLILGLAAVLGIGGVANGLFMLVDPANWYLAVPGVTTTGPFNQHFIRDIGLIFALIGAAMLGGAMLAAQRVKLWSASASWLTGHALFHLWEVSVGICGSDAIARDFPAVTLPAILSTALACWAWRDARRSKAQNAFS
ncbi:hypothetical protein KZ820_13810 [Sphingomonas sp. RRHST34]|uniref:Uncharacterized protein n=2 Tax=Sphingomonas citri TaxID=2862499 RepID=A0ABS7BQY1_9SPHN|nr:hypothetical protein [Sphingomonas citri]